MYVLIGDRQSNENHIAWKLPIEKFFDSFIRYDFDSCQPRVMKISEHRLNRSFISSSAHRKHFRFTSIFHIDFHGYVTQFINSLSFKWLLKILPFEVHVFRFVLFFYQVNYRSTKWMIVFHFNLRKENKHVYECVCVCIEKRKRNCSEWSSSFFLLMPVVPTLLFALADDGSSFLFSVCFTSWCFTHWNFAQNTLLAGYALCICVRLQFTLILSLSLISLG